MRITAYRITDTWESRSWLWKCWIKSFNSSFSSEVILTPDRLPVVSVTIKKKVNYSLKQINENNTFTSEKLKINLKGACLVTQSCLILCDSMDCTIPGSSVHGISQARILEWVAIPFSRGTSWPRDWTRVSRTPVRPSESPGKPDAWDNSKSVILKKRDWGQLPTTIWNVQ